MNMKTKLSEANITKLSVVFISILLVFVSGFIFSGCMPSDEQITAAEGLIKEGQDLYAAQQYADAFEKYEAARVQDEGNIDIYIGIADIYLLKNRPEDASEVLEVGVSKSREPSEGYVYLGRIALDKNDADLAVSYLRTAVNSDKDNYEARYLLAVAQVEAGAIGKADDTLDSPEEAGDWFVWSKLLEAVLHWDDITGAQGSIVDARSVDISDSDLENIVDDYANLLDDVEELLDEDASSVHVAVALSYGALLGGYEDVVISNLGEHITDNDEYWDLHLYLGRAYYMNDDLEKSRDHLTEAVSLNPVDSYGPWYLARVLVEEGSDTKAQELYERAIGLAGVEEKSDIRREYVDALMGMGQYASAEDQIRILEEGAESESERISFMLMRVESFLERELHDDASEILDAIDRESMADDLDAEYLWARGVIAFNRGDRSASRGYIEDALELANSESKYFLLLGQIQFEEGESEAAQMSLERAVDLDLDGEVSVDAVKILDRI